MKRNLFLSLTALFLFSFTAYSQSDTKSEDEIKQKANSLFIADNFIEAKPIYAQLLSLYPQDPNYNYRYGACELLTNSDKSKPLKYLKFAITKGSVDPLAYYYLGKAYHLNYEFAKAVKFYSRYKTKAKPDERTKYQVERQIEMCKNGNKLLSKLNDVQVIERQVIAEKDFYRIYETEGLDGKLIAKPEDFQTKYDKKKGEKSIIFLPNDAKEAYFSSYGKKGENGKDIYKAIKLGNGTWSEPVSLGASINTKYDEDFAFIHPDGRTLYFASKGHSSMGGYDIFRSIFDDQTGNWAEPENLDFAFSSADDDIMFITDKAGILAYFASNRSNEVGKYTVYKVLTDKKPAELSVISGTFIAESDPENKKAKITVIDKATKETIGVYETDEEGNYAIEITENGGDYQFNIETTENAPIHTGVVSIPKQDEFEVLGQELRLVGVGDEQQLVIKNIFDGTAAASISSAGPQISSALIRMKANLDVNYKLNKIDELASFDESSSETDEENVDPNNEANANNTSEEIVSDTGEEVNNDAGEEIVSDSGEAITSGNRDELANDSSEDLTNTEEIAVDETGDVPTGVGASSAEVIKNQFGVLKANANRNLSEKQQAVNAQYAKGLELQKSADQLFAAADQLVGDGASSVDIEIKKKEAGIEALKAAYATKIAQEIEESITSDLSNLDKIENIETVINSRVDGNELAEAELELNNLKQSQLETQSTQDVVNAELGALEESDRINTKKIEDYGSKRQSFNSEKAELNEMLTTLDTDLEKASSGKKEDIQKNIDALKLDLEDINYQNEVMNKDLIKTQYEKKAMKVEKNELLAASNRFNSLDPNSDSPSISEEEKNGLITKLKLYQDNDVIAYSPTNELYANEIDSEIVADVTNETGESANEFSNETNEAITESEVDNTLNELYSNQAVSTINTEFEEKLTESKSVLDRDLKIANQIKVYEDWTAALGVKKNQAQENYDSEINETERVSLKDELDNIRQSITQKNGLKRDLENELLARASGETAAQATPIADISEINDQTIVDDDFTNFKFDQSYQSTNETSKVKLVEAKRTLYEASQISKQSDYAQESAYTLPTEAERTEAFNKVNSLKKESEIKQLKAAEIFAEFNAEEYELNKNRIRDANRFGTEYESGSLDIAVLLAEEADVYYNDAAEIRASINSEDRLTQKEVELQKAYDYEMLALQKQKQAMVKLSLVVSEAVNNVLNPGISSSGGLSPKHFVQIITDEDVLAVTDAKEAKAKAETLSAEVVTLQAELDAQTSLASNMADGAEKDSLVALTETLQENLNQKINDAAIMYERENQIKSGYVGLESEIAAPEQIVLNPRKATIIDQIAIDTVEVNDERKQLILNSQNFSEFSRNREDLAKLLKETESSYSKAIELARENEKLRKQAIIESNMAKFAQDEAEKERLIKSAEVINLQVAENEKTIASLNKVIKVKNFMVITLSKKDNQLMANLSEIEKAEYRSLTKEIIPAEMMAEIPVVAPVIPVTEEVVSDELSSSETSGGIEDLTSLDPTESNIGSEEAQESSFQDEFENRGSQGEEISVVDKNPDVVEKSVVNEEISSAPVEIKNIDVIPRQIKEAIFITLEKDESAYSDNKPIPAKVALPEGIIYKVQVGAFRNPIPQNLFKGFAPMMSEDAGNGITRYTAGLFVSENSAINARNEIRQIGYPDAFVVAFLNGERIGVSQARKQTGEKVVDNAPFVKTKSSNSGSSTENISRVSGGSKEALSAEFNEEQVEDVVNAKTVEGLYFTVQIGVYSAPVKKGTFEYSDLNVVELSNGLIRYNAGMYDNATAANDLKNSILGDIKDAFTAAYYNGKRVSLSEAARLQNE